MTTENRKNLIWYFNKWYGNAYIIKNSIQFNHFSNDYDFFQKERILSFVYWNDLNLILIQYHISTPNNLWDFDYALNAKPLGRYSSKEKAISVIIPVILEEYLKLSPQERKQKFADDAIYAVRLVQERLEKKKLDIDFDKLLLDLEKCNKEYLSK